MQRNITIAIIIVFVGCSSSTEHTKAALSRCDRLEIWRAVLIASTVAKQTSDLIKQETGRDEYDEIYRSRLAPTLQRYGVDRTSAFLIFEEEGGWPYDPSPARK